MTIKSISIFLHVLSVVIWVGGMFFAYMALRPVAAQQLEPPQRLRLWAGVFARFFPFVWIAIILLPATGYTMIFSVWQSFANTPVFVHIMNGLGTLMILLFLHVYFAPYRRLREAVTTENWPTAGNNLNQIRKLIGINLSLGLLTVMVATIGEYLVL